MSSSAFVHLFHIIIVGCLFLYVGIVKTNMPSFVYPILLVLGIVIILYHTFKAYKKLKDGKNPWVNYIHIFIIGPLLVFIGLNREKTSRFWFEILLMLGFASIGYHGYYLFNE
jgi:Na+-transporting methylmalonyl-CoA/oxaloacetate decarboxylase beta subunit